MNFKKLQNKEFDIIANSYKTYFIVNKKHHYDIIVIYKVTTENNNNILKQLRYLNTNNM